MGDTIEPKGEATSPEASMSAAMCVVEEEENAPLCDEPAASLRPQPCKRKRAFREAFMAFFKDEAKKEEDRFNASQTNTKRFIDLFEELVKINLISIALYLYVFVIYVIQC